MNKKSLLILLMALHSWLPWTTETKDFLAREKATVIFTRQPGLGRGQWSSMDPQSILINSQCAVEALPMVTLHETQHLLAYAHHIRGDLPDLTRFERIAIACAKETEPQQMRAVLKFADLGPAELHAQLPWLLKGKLCPKLHPWYPWFDLGQTSWVAAPQEDAAWSIGQ